MLRPHEALVLANPPLNPAVGHNQESRDIILTRRAVVRLAGLTALGLPISACRGILPISQQSAVTADTNHRPWPLPSKPWAVAMRWHHLAFLHWPLDASIVRLLVPSELDVEVFEGHAWVGITPFGMTGVRPRWLPRLPWVSAFPELTPIRK